MSLQNALENVQQVTHTVIIIGSGNVINISNQPAQSNSSQLQILNIGPNFAQIGPQINHPTQAPAAAPSTGQILTNTQGLVQALSYPIITSQIAPQPPPQPPLDIRQAWINCLQYCSQHPLYLDSKLGLEALFNPNGPYIFPQPVKKVPLGFRLWQRDQKQNNMTADAKVWGQFSCQERESWVLRSKAIAEEASRQILCGMICVEQ